MILIDYNRRIRPMLSMLSTELMAADMLQIDAAHFLEDSCFVRPNEGRR